MTFHGEEYEINALIKFQNSAYLKIFRIDLFDIFNNLDMSSFCSNMIRHCRLKLSISEVCLLLLFHCCMKDKWPFTKKMLLMYSCLSCFVSLCMCNISLEAMVYIVGKKLDIK
jgi:hypothetical protein